MTNVAPESPHRELPAPTEDGSRMQASTIERCWYWLGWAIAVAGVVFWAQQGLIAAKLPFEDGTVLFQRHFQEVSPSAWFGMWGGYSSLVPNLLASLLCRLPTSYVPVAFTITASSLVVVSVTRLLDHRFGGIAPLPARVVVVAGLAWLPFGDIMISASLMFVQVALLLWLVLALLRPGVSVRPVRDGLIVTLLTWTHPMSVALTPISLWRMREATMRPVAVVHLVASAAYFFLGRAGGEAMFLDRIAEVPAWIVVRAAFQPVFGESTSLALYAAGFGWLAVAVGTSIVAVLTIGVRCAWPRWAPATRQLVLGLTWMCVASAVGAVLLRGSPVTDSWAARYAWPGRAAFITVSLLVATTFVRPAGVLLLVAAWAPWLAQFAAQDWRYVATGRTPEFSAFLDRIAEQEGRPGGRRALDVRVERPEQGAVFTIELKPR